MIKQRLIQAALYVAKWSGMFFISEFITANGLRILCYHGIAVHDEHRYRGTLFVRQELFRRRLERLRSLRCPILSLEAALQALDTDQLPSRATVITMDDGWRGVYSGAAPIINEFQIPVVVYVSTFYIEQDLPVFSVTLSYLFWRTRLREVELPRGLGRFRLDTEGDQADATAQQYGLTLPPHAALTFLKELAEVLGVCFDDIERHRLFRVLTRNQLQQLVDHGINIQLHTHHHQWSLDDIDKVREEISENRAFLGQFTAEPLVHFCYPSGIYGPKNAEWLRALGIKSAVTIDPGFNYENTPRFALKRIVDGESVTDVEFEAELRGFIEIIRAMRRREMVTLLKRRFLRRRPPSGNAFKAPTL